MARKPAKKTLKKSPKLRVKRDAKKRAEVHPEDRVWGTLPQCLKWLKDEGYTLAEKNAYAHYGPASDAPVKRDAQKRWFYPELIERVRVNRHAVGTETPGDEVARARLRAELRIKEAQAKKHELHLKKLEGSLIEKVAVIELLHKIKTDIESGRKVLVSKLATELHGKDQNDFQRIIDGNTWDWLARFGERIREL